MSRNPRLISARILLFAVVLGAFDSVRGDAADELQTLFQEEWQARLSEDPLQATLLGVHTHDNRMPSMTMFDLKRRHEADQNWLERLRGIERQDLSAQDQVSYDLFEYQLESRIKGFEFGDYRLPFTSDSGFFTSVLRAFEQMPLASVEDFDIYLERLSLLPRYFAEQIVLMTQGIREGHTMPAVVLPGVMKTVSGMLVDTPTRSPFFKHVERSLTKFPERESESVRSRALEAVEAYVMPSYTSLADFLQTSYLPAARTTLAARALPNGSRYYEYLVRYFTTQNMTPSEVHEIGLSEVKRIRAEMDAVLKSLEFEGDFSDFLNYLRTEPKFYPKTGEELLREAAWIAKRIDGILPQYFTRLPRMPYGVAPVPEHLAPNYTTGRYSPGVPGGSRGGYYWVNTYALEKRPLYALPALTLHEAVPGHHLQIALAQELEGMPEFRRHLYINAFGEGWALYAEKLGKEMGVYRDAYEEFGRLTYEMWRAGRLVVDTGIHYLGWTREQAVALFVENSALSRHNIETEVDRYISWPGQALSYKMGELTIVRLRREAEKALGPAFDVRQFHDVVLQSGGVTMSILDAQVREMVATASR